MLAGPYESVPLQCKPLGICSSKSQARIWSRRVFGEMSVDRGLQVDDRAEYAAR